jgi:acetyltransferase-like isoleucine patch superfamily enzyme
LKALLKGIFQAIFLIPALPLAAMAGFGRFESGFQFWSQACSLAPGLPGDYLRVAYYRLTLEECSRDSRIQFLSFFSHSRARLGRGVFIGGSCILGHARIGDRTQIASGVQVLSGKRQHARGDDGRLRGADFTAFDTISIGADCWIGAGAIIMADVGDGCTIGAGSVVTQPVAPRTVAAGTPARAIR